MGRVFSDLPSKAAIAMVPVILAIAGWAYSLDGRLRDVTARQEERGPRIDAMEHAIVDMRKAIADPSPRPETRVAMTAIHDEQERIEQRIARIEERINNLHIFILQAIPSPRSNQLLQRRGEVAPTFKAN